MTLKTAPLDAAAYLDTPQVQEEYLSQILADGDAAEVAYALGVLARARGMTEIAKAAGLNGDDLDQTLARSGHPSMELCMRVISALGYRLQAVAAE